MQKQHRGRRWSRSSAEWRRGPSRPTTSGSVASTWASACSACSRSSVLGVLLGIERASDSQRVRRRVRCSRCSRPSAWAWRSPGSSRSRSGCRSRSSRSSSAPARSPIPRLALTGCYIWLGGLALTFAALGRNGGVGGGDPTAVDLFLAAHGLMVVGLAASAGSVATSVLTTRAPGHDDAPRAALRVVGADRRARHADRAAGAARRRHLRLRRPPHRHPGQLRHRRDRQLDRLGLLRPGGDRVRDPRRRRRRRADAGHVQAPPADARPDLRRHRPGRCRRPRRRVDAAGARGQPRQEPAVRRLRRRPAAVPHLRRAAGARPADGDGARRSHRQERSRQRPPAGHGRVPVRQPRRGDDPARRRRQRRCRRSPTSSWSAPSFEEGATLLVVYGAAMAVFGGVLFWAPKLWGRVVPELHSMPLVLLALGGTVLAAGVADRRRLPRPGRRAARQRRRRGGHAEPRLRQLRPSCGTGCR